MKSHRWLVAGLIPAVLALGAACAKSSPDKAAPKAADSATIAPGSPTEPTPPAPTAVAAPDTAAIDHANQGGPTAAGAPGADLTAIGADKAKVIALAGATAAETESYVISLAVPAKAAKGAETVVTVDIKPKKGWHLNKEFPTKLTVTPPAGVELKKAEQILADATVWTDDAGQFTVRFTAGAAGKLDFAAKLKFAVCTESTCDPKKEQLAWAVAVE